MQEKNPSLNPELLRKTLEKEVKNHAAEVLEGISRYFNTAYQRDVPEPPAIWRNGTARLLDYGTRYPTTRRGEAGRGALSGKSSQISPLPDLPPEGEGKIVLFIPSLINRYYILDLDKERSLLRYLASQGHHPLVLDWGKPSENEKDFSCEDYITKILIPAIEYLAEKTSSKITLAGYCMGGVLSLAAAQLAAKHVAALALLATPWNFHCDNFKPLILDASYQQKMAELVTSGDMVPAEIIQTLFYLTDPWVFEQKFKRFAKLELDGRAAKDFIALEHWVNDGIPMTSKMARDCLIGWAQENQLAAGSWQIANSVINPKKIKIPTYVTIPRNDHVVPYDCALPLAKIMKQATVSEPKAGHVSMIVGANAKRELWEPLSEWLSKLL